MHPITCHEIIRAEHRAQIDRISRGRREPWPRRDRPTRRWGGRRPSLIVRSLEDSLGSP
jgi:hypothetical protein